MDPITLATIVCLIKDAKHPDGHFAPCEYAECMKEPQANYVSRAQPGTATPSRATGGILGQEFGRFKWTTVAPGVSCLRWCKDDTSIECVPGKPK